MSENIEVTENVVESAYFHINNGGLSVSIKRIDKEEMPSKYVLVLKTSAFGIGTSYEFPLSPITIGWLSDVFSRLYKEVKSVPSELSKKAYNPIRDCSVTRRDGQDIDFRWEDGKLIEPEKIVSMGFPTLGKVIDRKEILDFIRKAADEEK